MNFYVIKRNRKDYEIEKYTQEEWETVKELQSLGPYGE